MERRREMGAGMTDTPALFDSQAEAGLLGSILLDGGRCMDLCVAKGLRKEAFHVPAHSLVFRGMDWLHKQGRAIDALTVGNALAKHSFLEEVGGTTFLDGLIDATPTAAHAEHYLDIVSEKWLARQVLESTHAVEVKLEDGNSSPQDVLAEHIHKLNELHGTGNTKEDSKAETWAKCKAQVARAKQGAPMGLPSPWPTFNQRTGGGVFGGVTLVVGHSGTRKSFLLNQWGIHAAIIDGRFPGCYFSFEDSKERALNRAACLLANLNVFRWERGWLSGDEEKRLDDAAQKIIASNYDIRGGRNKSLAQRRLEIARGVSKHGWVWVGYDALKDVEKSGGDPKEEAKFMGWLADVSEEFGIALILSHHLNKGRSKVPLTSPDDRRLKERIERRDIKGAGAIEQSSRLILALQCQSKMVDGSLRNVRYVLDTLKANYGPEIAVPLSLDFETGWFTERKMENPDDKPFDDWSAGRTIGEDEKEPQLREWWKGKK